MEEMEREEIISTEAGENVENTGEEKMYTEKEVQALRIEIACAKNGVREDCIEDVKRLAESEADVERIIKKYHDMSNKSGKITTGVSFGKQSSLDTDKLRKAFGLI